MAISWPVCNAVAPLAVSIRGAHRSLEEKTVPGREWRSSSGVSGRYGWIKAVSNRQTGLIQHMSGNRGEHLGAGKFAIHRTALHIERVQREDIMMHDAVVPGRAWAVVTEVAASHRRVAGKPFPIVIDALAGAARAVRPRLAAGRDALGELAGQNLRGFGGRSTSIQ